jgi:hypothetical protein
MHEAHRKIGIIVDPRCPDCAAVIEQTHRIEEERVAMKRRAAVLRERERDVDDDRALRARRRKAKLRWLARQMRDE